MSHAYQDLSLTGDNPDRCSMPQQRRSGLRSWCPFSAKQLVVKYPAMCVAAWAYITAAVSMGITALLFVERSGWEVPRQLLGPLVHADSSLKSLEALMALQAVHLTSHVTALSLGTVVWKWPASC